MCSYQLSANLALQAPCPRFLEAFIIHLTCADYLSGASEKRVHRQTKLPVLMELLFQKTHVMNE